jgi:hypothetical protein
MKQEDISLLIPKTVSETYVRIYCRDSNPEKVLNSSTLEFIDSHLGFGRTKRLEKLFGEKQQQDAEPTAPFLDVAKEFPFKIEKDAEFRGPGTERIPEKEKT